MNKIPVSAPHITKKDRDAVMFALDTGDISGTSSPVSRFEELWASMCGKRYGVAVCNGTIALEMAMKCLDLPVGKEVLVPSFTIISCLTAIVDAGLKPVLVDAYDNTWTMNLEQAEAKITKNTIAIMPVHIYGVMVNMVQVSEMAYKYGLYVIEDASEAHGASYGPWRAGQQNDLACFSFYANKIVACGEGGMIVTNDSQLYKRLQSMRNLSHMEGRRFAHYELGHNYRMGALQAALGWSQAGHLAETIYMKWHIADIYNRGLSENPMLRLPVQSGYLDGQNFLDNVYWMYGVVLRITPLGYKDRVEWVMKELALRGVETRPFFLGMHRQPALLRLGLFEKEYYPVTDDLSNNGFYLPSGPNTSDKDIDYVIDCVNEVVKDDG